MNVTSGLGKYNISEKLGDAPSGSVYKGYANESSQTVAIRTIGDGSHPDESLLTKWTQEAISLAKLRHPHIAAILEVGEVGDVPYIVTEYLEGTTFQKLIDERIALPIEKKLAMICQAAEGLDTAHKNRILHGSLDPEKIHISVQGVVKIRDFSVASLTEGAPEAGLAAGDYEAPERIEQTPLGPAADVYALAAIAQHLFTLVHPVDGREANDSTEDLLPMEDFPDIPMGPWPILEACQAPEPEHRSSAGQFADAIRELSQDLAEASQLMVLELEKAAPKLRKISGAPSLPLRTAKLLRDFEKLLERSHEPDYATLCQAMQSLGEQQEVIRSVSHELASSAVPADALTVSVSAQPEHVTEDEATVVLHPNEEPSPAGDASQPRMGGTFEVAELDETATQTLGSSFETPSESGAPNQASVEGTPGAEQGIEAESRVHQWVEEAFQLLNQRDYSSARERVESVFDASPGNSEATNLLLLIERAQSDAERESKIRSHLVQAEERILQQRLVEAENELKIVLELDSGNTRAVELSEEIEQLREAELSKRQAKEREAEQRQIDQLLSVTEQSLERQDYDAAVAALAEVQKLDPASKRAAELSQRVEAGRAEDERSLQIEAALAKSQEQLDAGEFEGAITQVNQVLELDPSNERARSLLAGIQSSFEKSVTEEASEPAQPQSLEGLPDASTSDGQGTRLRSLLDQIEEDVLGKKSGSLSVEDEDPAMPETAGSERIGFPDRIRALASRKGRWVGLALLGATVLVAAAFWVQDLWQPGGPEQVASVSGGGGIRPNAGLVGVAGEAPDPGRLLQQAQDLFQQGELDASRASLLMLLDDDPDHEEALVLLDEIDTETKVSGLDGTDEDRLVGRWIRNTASWIKTGRLTKARRELDKIEKLRPDHPQIASLRTRWRARSSEIVRQRARQRKNDLDSAKRKQQQKVMAGRVEALFEAGQYDEAQGTLDRWLADYPENSTALGFQSRTTEAQRSMEAYTSSLYEGKYDKARLALEALASLNPNDPKIAELTSRVDARLASARATLTVHRLGEPATILLDGQSVGGDGEVEKLKVGVGEHEVSVRNALGQQTTRRYRFLDGQELSFVYDAGSLTLREMTKADQELVSIQKHKEQIHRFFVEHSHGWLRGSCEGVLLMNYYEVEFRPEKGTHQFRMPFNALDLRVDDDKCDLSYSKDGEIFQKFKMQDARGRGR